ncbi:hypothetical protein [Nesterenkonia sp. NBAIMH1]|uniref:hypothetical protein n=1 Tax=Nesterenkonia sp. NBAIMH1 TaxID=2600320 RepID=UPI0011B3CF11|nr:hypothetical protein [Nesterenkonia sp. NBAIMH1]
MKIIPPGLFAGRREARRKERELGSGLWRQAYDRFERGIDRYHQILGGVEDDAVHNQLVVIGDQLADQLPLVYDLCRRANERWPGTSLQIPGGSRDLHAALSRAANHVATTAEAEAMVRLQHSEVASVQRRADQVLACLTEAEGAID